jgi:hypothetical protein
LWPEKKNKKKKNQKKTPNVFGQKTSV